LPVIERAEVRDIRFPTSETLDGSDAMNPDGDYSAAYVVLHTDDPAVCGFGLTFTLGRGTELCVQAAGYLAENLVGLEVDGMVGRLGDIYREVLVDSQLRWLGPEKGVVHLAKAAVMNAVWDLVARNEGKPVWRLVCDMTPAELVAACDFQYLEDVLPRDEAIDMLTALLPSREERVSELLRDGYPAYTTSPGWLGYDDEKLRRLCKEAVADGWNHIKLKVGRSLDEDLRRCAIAREAIGQDRVLMLDANQVWGVRDAITWVNELRRFNPLWIEEPTSPDDILGHREIRRHIAPVGVATGEHAENRVIFKQLLQAEAIDFCQIDSCRLASINEIVPIMLMAAKFGIPVCPHAGGVGLCEYVQHLSIIDYVCISGSLAGRMTEFVDHLHEHFVDPVVIERGRYLTPTAVGYSIRMRDESIDRYSYPDGLYWRGSLGRVVAYQEAGDHVAHAVG
jgi:L-fuconate dehydratase